MKLNLVVLISSAFLILSCGSQEETKKSESHTVNGKPAAEYFGQFYSVDGQELCKDGKTEVEVPILAGSNHKGVDAALALYANSKYSLTVTTSGDRGSKEGSWHLNQTDLVIGDVAVGRGLEYNGQPAVMLTFNSNSAVPSFLHGQNVTLFKSTSRYKCPPSHGSRTEEEVDIEP